MKSPLFLSLLVAFAPAAAFLQDAASARELLARGSGLIRTQPAEALQLLRQALRIDPQLPALHYQLGLAYHALGDEAEAEPELRAAAARTPQSAPVHNDLGIVLFLTGDLKGALDEFRAAVRLAPRDANAHFNLAEALARSGQTDPAVEELRVAAGLAPSDTGLTRLLHSVENKLAAPGSTIKVDVRQVLVPVVVTDREGHHVTGLKQDDFQVYEDGAEQKITAFSVESSGDSGVSATPIRKTAEAAPRGSVAPPAPAPAVLRPRRTYLILIDTLHASFTNFASARDALVKLFRQEHSEDSQYVVIALGISPEMVLNVTPDPDAVLAALQNKRFQKIFLDGQFGGVKPEMERFRRDLVETRQACNLAAVDTVYQIKCETGLQRLTERTAQIAELDRTMTVSFLREFRSLVSQLARARDRRTVVLISDGFLIEPGREAYGLMDAYFPYGSHCLIPQNMFCPPSRLISTGRMSGEFEPILRIAAAGNITIDTIDSRGLYGQRAFDASNPGNPPNVDGAVGRVDRGTASAEGNTLREIADATGGTAFHDNNDLLAGLQRAFADGRDYYTLAYVPANANRDGKFRAVTVHVRGRDLVVNAKRGYWAESADPAQ